MQSCSANNDGEKPTLCSVPDEKIVDDLIDEIRQTILKGMAENEFHDPWDEQLEGVAWLFNNLVLGVLRPFHIVFPDVKFAGIPVSERLSGEMKYILVEKFPKNADFDSDPNDEQQQHQEYIPDVDAFRSWLLKQPRQYIEACYRETFAGVHEHVTGIVPFDSELGRLMSAGGYKCQTVEGFVVENYVGEGAIGECIARQWFQRLAEAVP